MNREEFDKYLNERYKPELKWYDTKSASNKKWSYGFQLSIIVIAAIVPIFAALELKWITVILSAFVAAATGIFSYCKFEDHWHNYRTTCETLKKEKYYYDSKSGEYQEAENPEKIFVERVEDLISRENTRWASIRRKAKEETETNR